MCAPLTSKAFLWTMLSTELPVTAPARSQLPLTCSPFADSKRPPRISQSTFGPHRSGFARICEITVASKDTTTLLTCELTICLWAVGACQER